MLKFVCLCKNLIYEKRCPQMATAFPARIRSDAKRWVYFYPFVFYRHLQRPDELDVHLLPGIATANILARKGPATMPIIQNRHC